MQRLIENELKKWKNRADRKPLIVLGARQVGKSYTLLEFGKRNYQNIAYFYFENNDALQAIFNKGVDRISTLFEELAAFCGQPITPNTLVIFDEIQACPAAISALKRIQESQNHYHIACAGSLLGLVLHREDKNSFPVGKVDILNMYPMNFREFLMATDNGGLSDEIARCFKLDTAMNERAHQRALELYKHYLIVGGMPEIVSTFIMQGQNLDGSAFALSTVRSKQLALTEMYANDMIKYCSKGEAMRNIAVYKSITAQLGKENKKFQYKLVQSNARAKDYQDALFWLTKANVILKISKVNEGNLPLAAYEDLLSFKVYYSDVGLLTARSNLSAQTILTGEYGSLMKGALTENFVAEELCANGLIPYYWESGGTAELDFVLELNDEVVPIETKSNVSTKAKSLGIFRKKYGIQKSIRISGKNFGYENGIKSVPLYAVWCISEKDIELLGYERGRKTQGIENPTF